MAVEIIMLAQLLQRCAHIGEGCFLIEGLQLLHRHRTGGGEQRGLKQLGEGRHG